MKKIKVLVSGCNGTMGKLLCNYISKSDDMEVVCGYDTSLCEVFDFPIFNNIDDLGKSDLICNVNVWIDFSRPECTMNLLSLAKYYCIPSVIATTGFTEEQQSIIEKYSHHFPIFKAPNMSEGSFVQEQLAIELAHRFPNYSIEIVERHHSNKLDAPSGTALALANTINNALDNSMEVICGRSGKCKRKGNQIGISSVRGGNIVGEHTLYFTGKFDEFEITHRVYHKEVFVEGAIDATRFLLKYYNTYHTNRLFTMEDL